jgi:hypothetical protein
VGQKATQAVSRLPQRTHTTADPVRSWSFRAPIRSGGVIGAGGAVASLPILGSQAEAPTDSPAAAVSPCW